jgi:hypothetical protein
MSSKLGAAGEKSLLVNSSNPVIQGHGIKKIIPCGSE